MDVDRMWIWMWKWAMRWLWGAMRCSGSSVQAARSTSSEPSMSISGRAHAILGWAHLFRAVDVHSLEDELEG
eukprot:4901427-Prymnesium_polylepis.1